MMSLGSIFRVNVMFAVAVRGTFALDKQSSKFASREMRYVQTKGTEAETDRVAKEERKR